MSVFKIGSETYKSDLKLGERYRDKTTGVEGALVSVHFYEHACERGTLRYVNTSQEVVEVTFDAPEMVRISSGRVARSERTGGPERGTGSRSPNPTPQNPV